MGKTDGKKNKTKTINKTETEKTKKYKAKGNKEKKEKKNKNKKKHKWLKRIILTLFCLGLIIGIVGVGIIVGIFTSDKYKVTEEDFEINSVTSKIVSIKDGSLITEVAADENRRVIKLEEMGPYIPKAFVAIEDERFYSHSGIDIKRTAGAVLGFITGDSSYGGSTITQQLIKNSFDDKEDEGMAGVERKIREMARAYNLEKIWSKDQILERYLNYIYLGGYSKNIMGVEMASEYYFSKSAKELSLAEAAFLAGINNTPNSYNPFDEDDDNSELIKERTIDVLWVMKKVGYITSEEEYNNSIKEVEDGLKFDEGEIASKTKYSYHTAALIEQVIEDLMEANDWTKELAEAKLEGNGYIIYSTEDPTIQASMEEEFAKDKYIVYGKEKDKKGNLINKGHTQAAMVIIDHTTGRVVGCMGGLGEDADTTGLNRATQGDGKQPGSSIKPIAVIAPALERGTITAGTVYDDAETDFGGGYIPHNSDWTYSGLINIRQALAESSNIVHVKIMKELGPARSIKFLETLGINVTEHYQDLALALGTPTITPLQMAVAYAAIANDGIYIEPTFYTKVEDSEGNVILEPTQETRRVMSAENAYVLQNLLTAPARSGTAWVCYMSYMDVGAKTGSTNGYEDRWLCGFTPYYTAATWYGFDFSERPNVSGNNAANIWAAIMKPIHKNLETKRFDRPSGVTYAKVCLDTGLSATETCTRTTSEVFVKGTVPKACSGHETIKICKQTGKLATEKCPEIEEKSLLVKPPKEETTLWKTDPKEKYDVPTETCDVHVIRKVKMPNAIGANVNEAKNYLESLGLLVNIEYFEDIGKENDIVLNQNVPVDQEVEEGTTITLTVNKKPEDNNVGDNGQQGDNGNEGNNGDNGNSGDSGNIGDNGDAGNNGEQGDNGNSGENNNGNDNGNQGGQEAEGEGGGEPETNVNEFIQ